MITAAALLQLLIVAGALYDTARLLAPTGDRRASWLRRRRRTDPDPAARRRAVLEAAERRLVRQRLLGRIDAAAYRERMRSLADGQGRAGR
ncbi:hypothetical protein ACQEWB_02840 [Streptomyces sp. CA-249302]|uniref:hypothetical protein n=1 Tax=Streptomyces sp. CA-249302 TaxID=3240058 RepID=UPI003D8A77E5